MSPGQQRPTLPILRILPECAREALLRRAADGVSPADSTAPFASRRLAAAPPSPPAHVSAFIDALLRSCKAMDADLLAADDDAASSPYKVPPGVQHGP